MSDPAEARRRWWGAFFLTVSAGMLIWGQTVLQPHLGKGLGFLLYWLICISFTGLAVLTALLDVLAIRRRIRDQQRDLIERALTKIEEEEEKHRSEPGKPQDKRGSTRTG